MNKVNVPKLRFKAFEGEWESSTLGNVTKVTSGGTPNRNNANFWNGNVPWITTSLINFNIINVPEEYITEEAILKSSAKLFKKGTILMAMYGQGKTRGKVAVLGLDATTNQACGAIIPNDNLDKNYLFQNLAGRYDEIRDLSNEGGQQNLSGGIIKEIKISFPTLPEQQKIASFLTAVDEKIQQLSRKKELLAQYKKGVMHQLFSGKLRFKDKNGKDYPDWEEKKLGEVASKKSSNISANKIEENFGDFIIYGASGVLKKVDFYREENDYISIVKDGAGVGRLLYCKGKSSVLGTMEIISPKLNIDTYFLYCLLSNIDFVKYVTGSTIPHIYFKDYSNEICGIPTFPEQQKIANFLSNIDIKIENTNQEINKMQNFKKGLLQQMFV